MLPGGRYNDKELWVNLIEIRNTARHIAYQAGGILRAYYEGETHTTTKDIDIDIVTEADKDSERFLTEKLQDHFPDHYIVGEEGGGYGDPNAPYRWYIDPVDGTTNFANRLPVFSVSIALTNADLMPLVGVVYNPLMDEMFTAAQGHGATLNGKPLQVSQARDLKTCVLASGFPYNKATNDDNNLRQWGEFLVRTRGLRRMGSAAIDLCYVAAGRFDGYWESYLNAWDCLAGALMVTEAGGVVSDYAGHTTPDIYDKGRVVAAPTAIHTEMLAVLATVK